MPPNTLRVHTEYMLVKPVGPKSCGLSHECRDWRIFSSPSDPCRNCGDGDRNLIASNAGEGKISPNDKTLEYSDSNKSQFQNRHRTILCSTVRSSHEMLV
ncbi:hypothetical protein TNCV_1417811 [Trichonephila clavipes]|nr:hypothetical protein TNCV_1417811 [Trichonephila clavipes]